MQFPRLPDILVYTALGSALLLAALGRRENTDAPEAPPPPSPEEGQLLAPASAFDPAIIVKTGPTGRSAAGTAFSVADPGIWVTARHVVAGCARIGIVEAPGRAAQAEVVLLPDEGGPPSDIAILRTRGGAAALSTPLRPMLRVGERAFHPGFPEGGAGEATSRLIGRQTLVLRGPLARTGGAPLRPQPVLAWAEGGRTEGVSDLSGLSGAPVLNSRGEVVAVTVAEAPRRGRIYSTTPEALRDVLRRAHVSVANAPASDPITTDNYGRVADGLRRELRVAEVQCLDR